MKKKFTQLVAGSLSVACLMTAMPATVLAEVDTTEIVGEQINTDSQATEINAAEEEINEENIIEEEHVANESGMEEVPNDYLPESQEEAIEEVEEVAVEIQDDAAEQSSMNLAFNTVVTCQVTGSSPKKRYIINLNQPGRIDLNIMSYMKYGKVKIFTQDGTQLANLGISGGSSTSPKSETYYYDLEAGKYYIDLERDSVDGQYIMKVGHTPVEYNEQEPNNGTIISQLVQTDGSFIHGFISQTDNVDVFRVELSEAGRLYTDIVSCVGDVYFRIGDANRNYYFSQNLYYGSNENPKYLSKYLDLEAGTYYIYVDGAGNKTGKYQFNLKFDPAQSDDVEPNNGIVQAQPLDLDGHAKVGFISQTDSVDIYKIEVTESDSISVNIKSMIENIKLEVKDSKNDALTGDWIYGGSVDEPKYFTKTIALEKGTYYLKVYNSSYNITTGKYQIDAYSPKQAMTIKRKKITGFVTRMYSLSMNREPDAGGLAYWIQALEDETTTGYAMANFFVNSDEFLSRGLSDNDYLDIMYKAFFNREPDAGGKVYWMNRLQEGDTRQNIFNGFAYSNEYRGVCADYGIPFM